ncbi:MAG: cyclic nucleotide-binding protein [Deltaproteobacteria bacterium]|nr:cyclic nucleotide-binding protein [Deltaproteobacteria bacterium]
MLEIIQEAELFQGVSEGVLAEIVNEGEEVTFEEGAVIFDEGEVARHIYELIEGSVDLIMLKKEIVHLTVSRTGQIFGWSALVQPYTRTATAKCTAPARVIRLSSDSIEKIIENHPHEGLTILRNLARIITQRLRDAYTYIHYYG